MLALLLLAGARPVTMEELIDKIWGAEPINSARKVIQHYASDLRAHLGHSSGPGLGDMLPKYQGGYRLLADRNQVDVYRFRDLVNDARPLIGRDDEQAVRILRDALRQWGTRGLRAGEPLSGLTGQSAANARAKLQAEHRAAVIDCLEAELRLGHHAQLVPEILDLASAGPPDEELTGLLMLACHRAGRSAEALGAFAALRKRLADEVGADPGPDIEHLHRRILQQDPDLSDSHRFAPSGGEMRSPRETAKSAVRRVAEAARKGDAKKAE
ncbi:AfsR/SARP family transcriptional regulator [Nonomuraea sp. NEAU-A123]|uniref:AfsR/SARP family transcriptional regulator n=1 Tax=Nonomuraea sp. NEAU-A123 TaxID=2839649 RepID=UPI001BE45255|nr:AfsR/SARP family transcriptional regulator [Nonomuraea sp. NEAU-A123]MBT2230738.1 AfsR/SARP family transcriptional regulator [Nonomuraea sp. NEAU-A123]